MTKEEFRQYIRRSLGYPMVKVELTQDQIDDSIDYSLEKFKEWATGNANEEQFFTIALSAEQKYYDLPKGVITVVDYNDTGGSVSGGVNTLFTVENFLYNFGYYPNLSSSNYGNLISYHMALDFLSQLERYVVNKYKYKYHKRLNQIELIPTPTNLSSPQYVLIRAYMLRGALSVGWTEDLLNQELYTESFVKNYSIALCKEKLGYIRRKFSQFNSIGNTGIQLDGNDLISEAKEEKERLEEELDNKYVYEGYDISFS